MIRDNISGLAAIVAAIISIGGALAIVEAQQSPAGSAPVPNATKKASAAGDPRSKASTPRSAPPGMGAPPGRMLDMSMMKGMSGMAADDDPEMAELAQSESVLAGEASEIIAQYAETENPAERKQLAIELRQALAKQFEVQKLRRELELSRIEERVRRMREQIKKRDEARETIIDRRLAQLIDDAEGLGWAPPAGEARRGGTSLGAPPRGRGGPAAGHSAKTP